MDPAPLTASNKYLIVYAAIVISLALSFFFMRRGVKDPVRLRLKDSDPSPPPKSTTVKNQIEGRVAEKALNALFNWNGHTWDAYEVLGIPAGSSAEVVKAAFEKSLENADEESKHFFRAALGAINSK